MRNYLQRTILLGIAVILLSCSSDDGGSGNGIFNLNVGSTWVYKKYWNNEASPNTLFFSEFVDTVRVVGTQSVKGMTFARIRIELVNTNNKQVVDVRDVYRRVNSKGHLVEVDITDPSLTDESGNVLHPGKDESYMGEYVYYQGNIKTHLEAKTEVTIEGKNYSVYPFASAFMPNSEHTHLLPKTATVDYAPGVGIVRQSGFSLEGWTRIEDRLLYYKLK